MKTKQNMNKGFVITKVCRADMTEKFTQAQIDKLTDDNMKWIASKMGDSFCDCCYWNALKVWTKAILDEKE